MLMNSFQMMVPVMSYE